MVFDHNLFPLYSSLFLLTLVVLIIGVNVWKNWYAMLAIVPISLICGIIAYNTITNILGYPISEELKDNSLYLSHIESLEGEYIFVWIIEPKDIKPKAIQIPNTANNEEQLDKARQRGKQGIKQGLRKSEKSNVTSNSRSGNLISYDFQVNFDSSLKK